MAPRDCEDGLSRRAFIVGVSAGVVATSCKSKTNRSSAPSTEDAAPPRPQSFKEATLVLCLLVGPWTLDDRSIGEELLGRFLTPERLERFSKHAKAIAALPSQLPLAQPGGIDKIPLGELSSSERAALLDVVNDLYRMEEVRYYIADEPDSGTCMVDLSFVARKPT